MTDQELIEQFKRCEQWNDPVQWELLALAYYQRGYFLNAICCFERADAARLQNAQFTGGMDFGTGKDVTVIWQPPVAAETEG